MEKKPKYNFCWHCGRKLQANFHREYVENGHTYIVHKQCFDALTGKFPIELIACAGDETETNFN